MSRIVDAIDNLQIILEEEYMRSNFKLHLEPDAFYRFVSEWLNKKDFRDDVISKEQLLMESFRITCAVGYVEIVKDESLGTYSLAHVTKIK